jgi:hypothetical protein
LIPWLKLSKLKKGKKKFAAGSILLNLEAGIFFG